ncbi:hypothetical protein B0T13DRAFT_49575 [Neurospora crassa]|nr:hypothetical protein B0T13DRAFT_49575 [Neurospora crassa]
MAEMKAAHSACGYVAYSSLSMETLFEGTFFSTKQPENLSQKGLRSSLLYSFFRCMLTHNGHGKSLIPCTPSTCSVREGIHFGGYNGTVMDAVRHRYPEQRDKRQNVRSIVGQDMSFNEPARKDKQLLTSSLGAPSKSRDDRGVIAFGPRCIYRSL